MSTLREGRLAHKPDAQPGHTDCREQPYNLREVGPIEAVQLPVAMITSLYSICTDVDLTLFAPKAPVVGADVGPKQFLKKTLVTWLSRHPALAAAEVRHTGRNLHVLLNLEEPVVFSTEAERRRWDGIVRAVQAALPSDPDAPGLTALTRPVGSINSKTGKAVSILRPGTPVPADAVVGLADAMIRARSGPSRASSSAANGSCPARPAAPRARRWSRSSGPASATPAARSSSSGCTTSSWPRARPGAGRPAMAHADTASRGAAMVGRLRAAASLARRALAPGARDLPVLVGLTPRCTFNEPLENVLAEAARILVADGRIYVYGSDFVFEVEQRGRRRLVPLTADSSVHRSAAAILANALVCELVAADKDPVQFAPPRPFVEILLSSSAVRAALPTIETYATRPVFDDEFNLLGPGWHAGPVVLVHGPDVEPEDLPDPDLDLPPLDRLPPRTRELLRNFCFRDDADLANAVGFLVTILLINNFVAAGKPVALIDGNQPGLGKTLLGRVLGALMDGAEPAPTAFTADDAELGKQVCATLRGGKQSIVLIDNAKFRGAERIDSRFIESNSMAPRVVMRILGVSENFERPNDLIWVLTMNDTKASPDLVSRGVPIRLSYDGDPRLRALAGPDPVAHALDRRAEILGELAGMIVRWNRLGRPPGGADHRCGQWARTVGGIVAAAGLPGFLANYDEAAGSFNQALDDLAALAEAAAKSLDGAAAGPAIEPDDDGPGDEPEGPGLAAAEWEGLFRAAGVRLEALAASRSGRGRADGHRRVPGRQPRPAGPHHAPGPARRRPPLRGRGPPQAEGLLLRGRLGARGAGVGPRGGPPGGTWGWPGPEGEAQGESPQARDSRRPGHRRRDAPGREDEAQGESPQARDSRRPGHRRRDAPGPEDEAQGESPQARDRLNRGPEPGWNGTRTVARRVDLGLHEVHPT